MEAEKVAKQMADEKQDYNGKQNNGLSVLFSGLLMLISARRDASHVSSTLFESTIDLVIEVDQSN
jgi:hypothetical protein